MVVLDNLRLLLEDGTQKITFVSNNIGYMLIYILENLKLCFVDFGF